jgi:uncharacterized protein (UPF0248 family)
MGLKYVIPKIIKEEIKFLHFPEEDVLFSLEDKQTRGQNLKHAISLGNLEHQKIKIIFQDIEGIKEAETTIWGITDRDVILKQGTIIPIHRIVQINLF